MKFSRLKEHKNIEENIIKNKRNIFRLKKLKKEANDSEIKGIRNPFRLKSENKGVKYRYLETLEIFLSIKKKIIINQ